MKSTKWLFRRKRDKEGNVSSLFEEEMRGVHFECKTVIIHLEAKVQAATSLPIPCHLILTCQKIKGFSIIWTSIKLDFSNTIIIHLRDCC